MYLAWLAAGDLSGCCVLPVVVTAGGGSCSHCNLHRQTSPTITTQWAQEKYEARKSWNCGEKPTRYRQPLMTPRLVGWRNGHKADRRIYFWCHKNMSPYLTCRNTWLSNDCTSSLTLLVWLWLTLLRKVLRCHALGWSGHFLGLRGSVREWNWFCNKRISTYNIYIV